MAKYQLEGAIREQYKNKIEIRKIATTTIIERRIKISVSIRREHFQIKSSEQRKNRYPYHTQA